MAKKRASRKQPTKKAATRTRSTTSTTTAKKTKAVKSEQVVNDSQEQPRLFTSEEQLAFLQKIQRGSSPIITCQQMGLPTTCYLKTFSEVREFRDQYYAVLTLLSQNVLAALYRQAMEGNLSAQTNWLKAIPPPGWNDISSAEEVPVYSFNEALNELSDDELINLARAMEIEVPSAN